MELWSVRCWERIRDPYSNVRDNVGGGEGVAGIHDTVAPASSSEARSG